MLLSRIARICVCEQQCDCNRGFRFIIFETFVWRSRKQSGNKIISPTKQVKLLAQVGESQWLTSYREGRSSSSAVDAQGNSTGLASTKVRSLPFWLNAR